MGAATLGGDSSGSGGQQWRGEEAVGERGSVDRGRQRWWTEAALNWGALLWWERQRWGEPATVEFSGPPNSHDSGRSCRDHTAQLGHRPTEGGMGTEQAGETSINRCVRTPSDSASDTLYTAD